MVQNAPQNGPKMDLKTDPKTGPKPTPIRGQKSWFSIGFTTKKQESTSKDGKRRLLATCAVVMASLHQQTLSLKLSGSNSQPETLSVKKTVSNSQPATLSLRFSA